MDRHPRLADRRRLHLVVRHPRLADLRHHPRLAGLPAVRADLRLRPRLAGPLAVLGRPAMRRLARVGSCP